MEARLEAEAIDVTIPGTPVQLGHRHPMNKALDEAKDIFISMGFKILDGPEVELADYNFTKLNIAENHPSRDRSDTFYVTDDEEVLLRTQTSPMQIRAMEAIGQPPIRILAPGRVYRKDEVDATHSPMFHQIEGLVIDKGITMADLKGTLETLIKAMYGAGLRRPLPPAPLPVHRAELRGRRAVLQLPRQGLPDLQGRGLDRAAGRRHGAPEGAGRLRHRPGDLFRLCLRHRPGAYGHAPVQDQRHAHDLRKRHPLPVSVLRRVRHEYFEKMAP